MRVKMNLVRINLVSRNPTIPNIFLIFFRDIEHHLEVDRGAGLPFIGGKKNEELSNLANTK